MKKPAEIIDTILDFKGWNTVDLAEYLQVSKQNVSYWRSKEFLSKKVLTSLLKLKNVGINEEFIKSGEGPVSFDQKNDDMFFTPNTKTKNINQFAIDTYANISPAMSDAITLSAETFINIPVFSKGEFAVQVKGHSMKGYINNGDWIVIRRIHDIERIIYGEPYVVCTITNDLRTVKFVKSHPEPHLLWLCPYNTAQFDPQVIEKADIIEMYAIEGLFRDF